MIITIIIVVVVAVVVVVAAVVVVVAAVVVVVLVVVVVIIIPCYCYIVKLLSLVMIHGDAVDVGTTIKIIDLISVLNI